MSLCLPLSARLLCLCCLVRRCLFASHLRVPCLPFDVTVSAIVFCLMSPCLPLFVCLLVAVTLVAVTLLASHSHVSRLPFDVTTSAMVIFDVTVFAIVCLSSLFALSCPSLFVCFAFARLLSPF